jgi:protein O-GlcNAc transferase
MVTVGRNDPCPCGSGKKYKHCHGAAIGSASPSNLAAISGGVESSLNEAIKLHQGGRLEEAESLYREILRRSPRNAHVLSLMGILSAQRGDAASAADWIGKAVAIEPRNATYQFNLGKSLRQLKRPQEACEAFNRAISLRVGYFEAYNELGLAQMDCGNLDAAVAAFQRTLSLQHNYFEAHNNLGLVFHRQGSYDKAIASLRRALEIDPNSARARTNLGMALRSQGHAAEAIESHRTALKLSPRDPVIWTNLGNALTETDQYEEAIECFREAMEIAPDYAEAYYNWGSAYMRRDQFKLAAEKFSDAIEKDPNRVDALNGLGLALLRLGRVDQAISTFRRALQITPNDAGIHSALLFSLLHVPGITSENLFSEHREWARRHASLAHSAKHSNSPDPERRLRIGYVSGDFRNHSVGYFIEPVLTHHDRVGTEVFCYSNLPLVDAVTERLRGYVDHWREVWALDDQAMIERIRDDGIDILVDLSGHTSHNRLPVFARKPAPVQATWLGYLNTTGLEAIDYRITDRYASPEGLLDRFQSEKLLRLPDSQWCFQPPPDSPEISELPAAGRGFVTFASFSNLTKINEPVLELWCRLLEREPKARLVIAAHGLESVRDEYLERFASDGISPGRIDLLGVQSFKNYLALHNSVDLMLDTFPYTGGTTTAYALWMGVPIISLIGDTGPSRGGASLLSAIGLDELVAGTPQQYLDIAVGLVRNLERLSALRGGMRKRMAESTLMNAGRFAQNLERAYRSIWQHWCQGMEEHRRR